MFDSLTCMIDLLIVSLCIIHTHNTVIIKNEMSNNKKDIMIKKVIFSILFLTFGVQFIEMC